MKVKLWRLGIIVMIIVIGSIYNWQINPKIDSTIQTVFSTREIITAIIILTFVYGIYFIIRIKKAKFKNSKFTQENSEIGELHAPFRSKSDYDNETKKIQNQLKNQCFSSKQNFKGQPIIINKFSEGPKFCWDGIYLSDYSGNKLLKFDGKFVSNFAGNKLFKWENNCLSIFSGTPIYSAKNGSISVFSGPQVYSYNSSSISEFAGNKLYSYKSSNEIPVPILVIIAANLV